MKTTYVLPRAMIKDLVRLAICYGKTKRGAWIWVHESYTQSKRATTKNIAPLQTSSSPVYLSHQIK